MLNNISPNNTNGKRGDKINRWNENMILLSQYQEGKNTHLAEQTILHVVHVGTN